MEVIRSKNAGACYGVQRALDLALKASEGDGSAFTLGPLIHNPQVVANLEARGVLAVKEPEQATHGAIIIRSHGVTPAVRRSVEVRGLPVIDATCPHVARAQKAAATLAEECGYVVVVGEEGHPEVEGLVAYAHEAGAQVHVAETAADLPGDLPEHVGVVVQTTQTRDALDDVLEGIRAQGVAAQVKDTVCTATRQRQQAAAELAGQVDAIVVIGGPTPRIWPRSALRNARARTTSSRPPSSIPRGSRVAPPWASRQAPAPPTTRSTKWCSVWSACSERVCEGAVSSGSAPFARVV